MGSTPKAAKEQNKKKKKRIILIIIFILLAAMISVVILTMLGYIRFPWQKPPMMVTGTAQQGVLPTMTEEELMEHLQREADETKVTLQINTRPSFTGGGAKGDLMIQNPQFNTYDLYLNIYLGEDDTGQLVYESGKIEPGHYIDYGSLTTTLTKGDHAAIAYFNFYEGDRQVSTATANLILTIQN